MNAQVQENLVAVTIVKPNSTASDRASLALSDANALVVSTPEQYAAAAAELAAIKSKWNDIEAQRKDLVKPINEAHDRVQNFFRGPLSFLSQAEGIVKKKLADYQREQERIRQAEQHAANERARREREEIEARARETERKAREKAEADRKAAREAEEAGRAEEARKLKERADRTENKAAGKAQQLEQQAASVVAPVIQREAPKVPGLATREAWTYEIVDESQIPLTREYYTLDHKKIAARVKSLKKDANIPGVRAYPDKNLASSAR